MVDLDDLDELGILPWLRKPPNVFQRCFHRCSIDMPHFADHLHPNQLGVHRAWYTKAPIRPAAKALPHSMLAQPAVMETRPGQAERPVKNPKNEKMMIIAGVGYSILKQTLRYGVVIEPSSWQLF